jgi:hypothetical protein
MQREKQKFDNPKLRHMSDKRNENTDKKGTCVYEKTSTLVTNGRTLLQIEKKGRASLGQGRAQIPCPFSVLDKTLNSALKVLISEEGSLFSFHMERTVDVPVFSLARFYRAQRPPLSE